MCSDGRQISYGLLKFGNIAYLTRGSLSESTLNRDVKSWSLLIFLGFIWGFSFLAVSISLESFTPIQVAALRITLGALVVFFFCILVGEPIPKLKAADIKVWKYCLGMALFSNVIPFSLLSWSLLYVDSSFAGITMTMVPLAVLPLSHFFGKGDLMTKGKALGFFIGFIGAILLFEPFENFSFGLNDETLIPKLVCFLATLCYATGSIITRRSPQSVSSISFSCGALIMAALIILPISLLVSDFNTHLGIKSIVAILFLGLIPTGLATIILVYLVKNSGPSFMSLVNYQVPIWAIIFGVLFNGEVLPPSLLVGLFLIFMGLFLSQYIKGPTKNDRLG